MVWYGLVRFGYCFGMVLVCVGMKLLWFWYSVIISLVLYWYGVCMVWYGFDFVLVGF